MADDPKNPQPESEPPKQPEFDIKKTAHVLARQAPEDIMAVLGIVASKNPELFPITEDKPVTEPTPAIEIPKPAEPAKPPEPPPAATPPAKEPAPVPSKDAGSELESRLHAMEIKNAKLEAISEYPNLTKADIDLISGDSPEAVMASAKALSDRYTGLIAGKPAEPATAKPGAPAVEQKKIFANDSDLPPAPTGPVTIQEIARTASTPEGRKRIAAEAAAEGRRIYDSGGPFAVPGG